MASGLLELENQDNVFQVSFKFDCSCNLAHTKQVPPCVIWREEVRQEAVASDLLILQTGSIIIEVVGFLSQPELLNSQF